VKEVPHGGDGDFTSERLGEKYNADLANNRVTGEPDRGDVGPLSTWCAAGGPHQSGCSRPSAVATIEPRWIGLHCTKASQRFSG
jgi:hypothetical protein